MYWFKFEVPEGEWLVPAAIRNFIWNVMQNFEYHNGPDNGFNSICLNGMNGVHHAGLFWNQLETRTAPFEWAWAILSLLVVCCQHTPEVVDTVANTPELEQKTKTLGCKSPEKQSKKRPSTTMRRRGA